MEAALKEREKRLEEVKQTKSQKQEVSPTVLAYKKEVGRGELRLMGRWKSTLGNADRCIPFISVPASCVPVCGRQKVRGGTIGRSSSFCFLLILPFVVCLSKNDAANKAQTEPFVSVCGWIEG